MQHPVTLYEFRGGGGIGYKGVVEEADSCARVCKHCAYLTNNLHESMVLIMRELVAWDLGSVGLRRDKRDSSRERMFHVSCSRAVHSTSKLRRILSQRTASSAQNNRIGASV